MRWCCALNKKNRDDRIDTLKGILICLVVFGHLLELILKNNALARGIYILIYTFHMPLFVFTTGYFANYQLNKLLCRIGYPYVLFSVLYQLCAIRWWKDIKQVQIATPYWLLWYLLATAVWTGSIPLWNTLKRSRQWAFFLISILCACLAGNLVIIGRKYALSRIIVFFPFFLLGKLWHTYDSGNLNAPALNRVKKVMAIGTLLLLGLLLANQKAIRYTWLYEATPYCVSQYHMGIRLAHILLGIWGVCAAMLLLPKRKIKWVSEVGKHTLSVYLLHGFLIKTMAHYHVMERLLPEEQKIAAVLLLAITAAGIVLCLSAPKVVRFSSYLLAPWHTWKNTR